MKKEKLNKKLVLAAFSFVFICRLDVEILPTRNTHNSEFIKFWFLTIFCSYEISRLSLWEKWMNLTWNFVSVLKLQSKALLERIYHFPVIIRNVSSTFLPAQTSVCSVEVSRQSRPTSLDCRPRQMKTIQTCSLSDERTLHIGIASCFIFVTRYIWYFFAICNFVCSQGRKIKTTKPLPAYLMPSFKLVLPRAPPTLPPLLLIRPRSICEPKKYFCVKSADWCFPCCVVCPERQIQVDCLLSVDL